MIDTCYTVDVARLLLLIDSMRLSQCHLSPQSLTLSSARLPVATPLLQPRALAPGHPHLTVVDEGLTPVQWDQLNQSTWPTTRFVTLCKKYAKVEPADLCTALCVILVSGALRYDTCLRGITRFYLPPTRASTTGMSHTCLYSTATEHHRTLDCYLFAFCWG